MNEILQIEWKHASLLRSLLRALQARDRQFTESESDLLVSQQHLRERGRYIDGKQRRHQPSSSAKARVASRAKNGPSTKLRIVRHRARRVAAGHVPHGGHVVSIFNAYLESLKGTMPGFWAENKDHVFQNYYELKRSGDNFLDLRKRARVCFFAACELQIEQGSSRTGS